jgi:hypothetical protein
MARHGRKATKRNKAFSAVQDNSPAITDAQLAMRREIVGDRDVSDAALMRAPLGRLMGAWYARKMLTKNQFAAAELYAEIVERMNWLYGEKGHRDTLSRYLPQGRPPNLTEDQKSQIIKNYQKWFECINDAGAARDVTKLIQDDPTARVELVQLGLNACYKNFM